MSAEYTEKQIRIKEQFYADRGKWKWNDTWETILHLNEDILSAYSSMSSVPHKKGNIDPKTKGLIYVAIDNAITHYYTPGFMSHLRHGMRDLGATKEELMEVFVIASTIGVPTYTVGVPILVEKLKKYGIDIPAAELTEKQKELKERFIKSNGYWSYDMDSILKLDTEMFEGFLDYVAASEHGALDPQTRELIYIAVNASPTALNEAAMELHIEKALEIGVTAEQIIEVFELVACLGIHSVTVGIPAVNEVLTELEEK
jgi:alkylhydroperoxidase/carboxymuconolactone decarboxylase family protein YurZ